VRVKLKTYSKTVDETIKFTRDMIMVTIYQVITTLLSLITLPMFTKSYSAQIYGIWTQINLTNVLIGPILTLQFSVALIRYLAGEEDKTKRQRYLGAMLCTILIFSLFIFALSLTFAPQLSNFLFASPNYVNFVLLTFLWTFVDALFAFFISCLRAKSQIITTSWIQISFAISHMIVIVVIASLGLGLERIVTAILVVDLLFMLGTFGLIIHQDGFPSPTLMGMKKILLFSAPQIPTGLLTWIIGSSDRFFITHYVGLSETAIYSSSDLLGAMIGLFCFPICFVLLPVVSKAWVQNRRDDVKNYFEYSTKIFLTLAIPAAVGLAMLCEPVLKIITTSEYLAGWQLVLLVSIGTIFQSLASIFIFIVYLIEKTKWILLISMMSAIASISVNYYFIPRIGIIGGAIATITSYFILACIYFIWTRKIIALKINILYLCKVVIATIPMALFLYYLKANNVLTIILALTGGTAIFAISIFLLRPFSEKDKQLMTRVLAGLVPWLH
jgi:O-antigen/teichoic acid export membrane protein